MEIDGKGLVGSLRGGCVKWVPALISHLCSWKLRTSALSVRGWPSHVRAGRRHSSPGVHRWESHSGAVVPAHSWDIHPAPGIEFLFHFFLSGDPGQVSASLKLQPLLF